MAAPSITPSAIATAVRNAAVGAKFGQFTLAAKTVEADDADYLDITVTVIRGGNSWTGFVRWSKADSRLRLYSVVDDSGKVWTNVVDAWLAVT